MVKNKEINPLFQESNRKEVEQIGTHEWIRLYAVHSTDSESKAYFSALIPHKHVSRVMKRSAWDLMIGRGLPGFSQSYRTGKKKTTYHRFGTESALPIVFVRTFHDLKPSYIELLEEFRHYHDLYFDQHNNRYIRLDERGEDEVVAKILPNGVEVKTRCVLQFMAARRLYLTVFFDHRVEASVDIATARRAFPAESVTQDKLVYSFNIGQFTSTGRTFSRFLGKKLIAPPSVKECGAWPYEKDERRFAEYIIGVDQKGHEIRHTCDPDTLANYFGANPGAPNFLTPVWFRREVLQKYYDAPQKYEVEDGYIRCGSLWGLKIDNDLPDRVAVFLGDLGESLTYNEQLYWMSFNVSPEDNQPSVTNFRRSILAEFTDPTSPDLIFKSKFVQLQESWEKLYGWSLFRQLHADDAHIFRQLRVPLTENIGEFDLQTLFLTKILIDSLNDHELVRELGSELPDEKSIGKLERFLTAKAYPHIARDVKLLRLLQNIRSAAAAHGKGSRFDRISEELELKEKPVSEVFGNLLRRVNMMLDALYAHFVSSREGIRETV